MQISNISIIVAASTNLVIGNGNELPWHLPTDLKYFKEMTKGKTVIMGRKCWESIPEKYRPLPGRKNIVITRNHNYKADGAIVRHHLELAIEEFIYDGDDEVFVIGGAQIYKEAFPLATRLYLTQVYKHIDGDVKLEGLETGQWKLVEADDRMEENDISFRFERYHRK